MTTDEFIQECADITVQAAAEVVQNVFNSTPGLLRPYALAALRLAVESAIATMSEQGQTKYTDALEHLQCTVVKREKGATRHE